MRLRTPGRKLSLRDLMRPVHPSIARILMEGPRKGKSSRGSSRDHLRATMQWLRTAQDRAGGHGVSAAYSLAAGWEPPYPETTGYIIPTFYDYAAVSGQEEFRDRAKRMADWEISVQLDTGAVRAGYLQNMSQCAPAVFNTGQVILGYCRTYVETGDERYAAAAKAAGDWLLCVQNSEGAWRLDSPIVTTYVHAYDVRTAWSLLELHAITGIEKYCEAALRNVEWTLSQQHEDGWFANNSFERNANPYTHNIAYVMEGLLEAWVLTGDQRCWAAMFKTASRLLRIFEVHGFMPGEFAQGWKPDVSYSCLTGDAQIAGVWLRVFEAGGDVRFLNAALKLNDYVKGCQSLRAAHPAVRGGVKGSQPFNGGYTPFTYINWGAKFLADSLMLEERVFQQFEAGSLAAQGTAANVPEPGGASDGEGAQTNQAEPARRP